MKGKKVKSLKQLCALAMQRKAVVCNHGGGYTRQPAAFVQNMMGFRLNILINEGMYEYKKLTQKK